MKVYADDSQEKEFIQQAFRAGVPIGRIEMTLVFASLLERKPQEIQDKWMDAHVGVQQVLMERE